VRLLPCLFLVFPLAAQTLRVYSEFVHFDALGAPSAPVKPREILSPAVPRNGFTSLQISVQLPPEQRYFLYIRQNPENAVHIVVYREEPDGLKRAILPFHGSGPEVFWMDLWADRGAPPRRIKVEPQIRVGDDWFVYPMEIRVVDTTFPDGRLPEGSSAPATVMKSYLCGGRVDALPLGPLSIARLRFRNAQQDVALAAESSRDTLRDLLGGCEAGLSDDPEWYLRIRDYLLRSR
jgi:hypothetical protein